MDRHKAGHTSQFFAKGRSQNLCKCCCIGLEYQDSFAFSVATQEAE